MNKDSLMGRKWAVEMTLNSSIVYTEVNSDIILHDLAALTSYAYSSENWTLGTEMDKEGQVNRLIAFVDNEQGAAAIADAVNKLDKSYPCYYGYVCWTTEAHVVKKTIPDSSATNVHQAITSFVLILLMMFTTLINII